MPTCAVNGCTKEKRNKIDPDHKFFTFPRTSPLLEKWIKFCRKDSLTKEQCLTKGPKVCSIHFKEDCIEIPLKYRLLPQFTPKNMRILKKDAVPTIRNPKKKKEEEEDEKAQLEKKMEYSRIVAELLEQSEKDAAAEKDRQEQGVAQENEATGEALQSNIKQEIVTPKKTPKSKRMSSASKQKSPKKVKSEPPDSKTPPSSKKANTKTILFNENNSSSNSKSKKKKVSFADVANGDLQSDEDVDMHEPGFQTDDVDADSGTSQPSEDTAAELLRLQRENKKLTELTIKQSMQIADLIKQRNDLWREKGDLWFRKRMEQQ